MSVHKTPDGRWFVRYAKGKNELDQNRTREYFGHGLEGERKARERQHELFGSKTNTTSPMLSTLATEYLAARGPTMAKSSLASLKIKIEKIILPFFGRYRAIEITPTLIDRYVAARIKHVKKTTIHRDLSDLRAILRWAVKRKYIAYNPMEGFTMPKRDDAVIRPPTPDEVMAILKHAKPHLLRAIILAFYTGTRSGESELYSLKWHDIDLVGNTITITSADKNGIKRRDVPIMDQEFKKLLEKWLEEDRAVKNRLSDNVITYNRRPVKTLKKSWQDAKESANITRRIRMYDLRHAFATMMLDNGADLKHVSLLLGHKSVQQTVDTYQHKSKKLAEDAVNKIPSILGK